MTVKYMQDLKIGQRCVTIDGKGFYRDNFKATPRTCVENHISDLTAIKISNYLNHIGPDLSIDGKPIE